MAFVSPRMSLQIWNDPSDPFDSSQLADNFLKLDQHTHAEGEGVQIGADGIQDGAILTRHIYPGTITPDVLDPATRIPIGMVMDYYSATPTAWATQLGTTWRVCDGSTVLAANHSIPGVSGDFILPNLVNKFVLGSDPTAGYGSAGTVSTAPGVNGGGGAHQRSLVHSHTVNSHTHYVPWPFGENGGGGDWVGAIRSNDQGALSAMGYGAMRYRVDQTNGSWPVSPFGRATGTRGDGTSAQVNAGNMYDNSIITDAAVYYDISSDAQSPGTNNQLSSTQDFRPAYVGLLKVMKVK